MNFYNEDEDKKGAPVIPGTASPFKKTSAFGKTPLFSRATGGIIDRLKNLSRKDMAFVAIGLSVLVMAPVAEYMMSQPAQDNLLRETFNPRDHRSIIDPGINGLSTGSSDGSGEVITPLSARDPLSLILGAQPAQAAMPPPSAPPTTSYRDAMKESGRAAFTEASKSAGAPTVIPRMQSALRGISSFGAGGDTRTSGSLGGGKIIEGARSASSKAKKSSMIGPVAMAGYKGVASTPNSSSKGAFEKLRAQADKSAGNFSGGSAMNSLDKAAADALNISGAGGLGAGGDSEKTGKTSGSTNKYDKSRSGETLAEAAAKARQAKALEWEFFKQYEFKKQLLTAVFGAVSTEVGKFVGKSVKSIIDPDGAPPPTEYCVDPMPGYKCTDTANLVWKKMKYCNAAGGANTGSVSSVQCVCACGVMTKDGTPAASTVPTAPTGSTEQIAQVAKTFDDKLIAILQNVKIGADKYDSPKKLWKQTVIIPNNKDGLSGLLGGDGSPFSDITRGLNTEVNTFKGKVVAFRDEIAAAKRRAVEAAAAAQFFIDDVNKALDVKTMMLKEGAQDVTPPDTGMTSKTATLEAARGQAEKRRDTLVLMQAYADFLTKAADFYTAQAGVTEKAIGDMTGTAAEIRQVTDGVNSVMETIKEDDATATGNPEKVKAEFDKLWKGKDEANSAVLRVMNLRGAELKIEDWNFNDAVALDAEGKAWAAVSPRKLLLDKKDLSKFTGTEKAPLAANMAAVIKRAKYELSGDLKDLAGGPAEITTDAAGAVKLIEDLRKDPSINLPAGGPTTVKPPVNPPVITPPVVTDPTQADRQAALRALGDTKDDINLIKDGAKPDLEGLLAMKKNKRAQDAVTAYNKQMGSIEERMNGFEAKIKDAKDGKEIAEHVAKMAKLKAQAEAVAQQLGKEYTNLTKKPSSSGTHTPAKPQIIINNTVQGGNATAIAGSDSSANATATSKPTTNNTINNTVAKPPVGVPPISQPPKPVTAPKEFSVGMPNGTFMKLTTNNNSGASATYSGSYRSGMDWLYKYEVVCVRSGKVFIISRAQRTKALFSTGITVGGPEVSNIRGECK